MSTIDFGSPPPHHEYRLSIDPEESLAERNVRLFKDVILFVVVVCFVILIASLCVRTLLSAAGSPEEKKWAMSVLSAATAGSSGISSANKM